LRSAIVLGVVGLTFLVLAGLGTRFLPPTGIPFVFAALLMGVILLALGLLKFTYRPKRINYVSA
jgi:lipopolysaccharide export LptBFGC system permease protein LptF